MRETAKPYMVRLYKVHRLIIRKTARRLRVADAEAVRRLIEARV
jgi:hypothetical protein